MNKILPETKKILENNGWDSKAFKLFHEDYFLAIKKKYSKTAMKNIPDEYLQKLSVFNQMKLKIGEDKTLNFNKILSFNLKSIKCYSNEHLEQLAQKLEVKTVYWIGSYYTFQLYVDENENLYGYDGEYVLLFGKGIFEAINNIIKGKIIKEWGISE